ncbi:MAG: magnesium/cobalt transporter CorA [Gammaproteobacteria bacterium]
MARKRKSNPVELLARYSKVVIVRPARQLLGTYHRPGTAPGTLELEIDPAAPPTPPPRLSLFHYDDKDLREQTEVKVEDCVPPKRATDKSWLHVQGVPTPELLQRLAKSYGLHPLALEDVLRRGQRTKFEVYDDQYFVVINQPRRTEQGELITNQVSFFLGKNYVITFDDGVTDDFAPIRDRLRAKPLIRGRGADYLFYSLIDVVIDEGFPMLEDFGERMEVLEQAVLDEPTKALRNQIHYMKQELVQLRRAWWPQRDVMNTLIRDGEQFIGEATRLYLRDSYDHCLRIIDFTETYREMMSSLLDTYLSSVSQRMNDVMKVLTVVGTIFLPLTFITGLYGMNFDTASPWNLPELHWRYGYFYVLGVMLVVVLGMLLYFRRKRWL